MSNILSFTIALNDLMLAPLGKLGAVATTKLGKLGSELGAAANKGKTLGVVVQGLATNANTLSAAIDRLRQKRDLIPASNISLLRATNSELHRMEGRLNRLQTMNGSRLKTWASDALSQVPGAALLRNPLVMAGAGIGMAGKLAMEADRTETGIKVIAGDEQGGQLYRQLTKYANDTIFGKELHANAQMLLGFGLATNKVLPSIKMLGDVSMGNKEKLASLTLAYSQASAAGKLTGQDLLQFVNAGFNPLNEIATTTGKSVGALKKEMESGAITFAMVEGAFKSATSAGGRFNNMTQKMAETPLGKWEAFKGSLESTAIQLGKLVLPAFSKLLQVLSGTLDVINKYGGEAAIVLGTLGLGFVAANAGAVGASLGFRAAALASNIAASGVMRLSTALLTTPWGWALLAISAVAIGLKRMHDKTEEIRESTRKLTAIRTDAISSMETEKTRLMDLLAVYNNATKPIKEREAALKQLRTSMAGYAQDLKTEQDWQERGAVAIQRYTNQLYNQAIARGMQKRVEELSSKRAEVLTRNDAENAPNAAANSFYRLNAIGNALTQADFRPGAVGAFLQRQQAGYEKSYEAHKNRAKNNALNEVDSELLGLKKLMDTGGWGAIKIPEADGPGSSNIMDGLGGGNGSGGGAGKSMAENITGGGPRVININGVKFADTVQIHGGGGQTAFENSEDWFHDMFLRTLNSAGKMAN